MTKETHTQKPEFNLSSFLLRSKTSYSKGWTKWSDRLRLEILRVFDVMNTVTASPRSEQVAPPGALWRDDARGGPYRPGFCVEMSM